MQKRNLLRGIMAAASISMVVACAPTGTPTTPGTPSASVSPTATPIPSGSPIATPTPDSSVSPTATPMPSGSPVATPTPGSSVDPSATPMPTPMPTATSSSDISIVEPTTFNGKVYDEDNTPLSGVTVTVKSLNSAVPFEATANTVSGTYAFNNAPSGVQLEIVASRDGYATRRRVEVLKSNKDGNPDANRYDFGTDGSESTAFGVEYNALSDKPEVIAVTPARNASGIAPDTTFVLEFSESMDVDTVEENFAIHTSTDEELSVGKSVVGIDTDADEELGDGDASLIWDESAFDISWNSDDTQVTFTFQDEQQLPTDTESSNVPDYLVTFSGTVDDGQLKDASGVTRDASDEGAFKLTDGNFEFYYEFSIDTDEDEPQVNSVSATVGTGTDMDEVEVEFSEPMAFFTRSGAFIGGNGDDSDSESPLDPDNYSVLILSSGANAPDDSDVEDGIQPDNVRFDSDDETNSTVILEFADGTIEPSERVYVYADSDIVDPAGNSIDSSNDIEDDTAN